jgi:hypothetical protein
LPDNAVSINEGSSKKLPSHDTHKL